MKSDLIIGATGLVGSNLRNSLSREKVVICSSRNKISNLPNCVNKIFTETFLDDLWEIDCEELENVYYTIHSNHSDIRSIFTKLEQNVGLYLHLLEILSKKNFKGNIYYFSTEAVDRMTQTIFGDEKHHYALTHLLCEISAENLHGAMNVFNVRLPNLYGFNFYSKQYSGLLPILIKHAFRSSEVELSGDGEDERAFFDFSEEKFTNLLVKDKVRDQIYRLNVPRIKMSELAAVINRVLSESQNKPFSLKIAGKDRNPDALLENIDKKLIGYYKIRVEKLVAALGSET